MPAAGHSADRAGQIAEGHEHCIRLWKRLFRPANRNERDLLRAVKHQHIVIPDGGHLIHEGDQARKLYAVFDGWAVRHRQLRPGARQILEVLLPGDVLALASALLGASTYAVQAVTPAGFCVLDGRQVAALFNECPRLAVGVLRSRLEEEFRADARLVMLGRMGAEERICYFISETYDRLRQRGMADDKRCPFPLRRIDIADAVGLSKIHVMRALRELRSQALFDIRGRNLTIPDVTRLATYAGYTMMGLEGASRARRTP